MTSSDTSVDQDVDAKDAAGQAETDNVADTDVGEASDTEQRIVELESQLEELQQKASDAADNVLRTTAEMQNLRRRTERDVENAHKFGQEKLVSSLLPVLDNLDRALAAYAPDNADDAAQALVEGVELTRKTAVDALQKFSVEVLEPVGEPFDPEFHEAMTMIPSDTAEPNTVLEVLQKGYTLNGRLLRAAMVVVSK